MYFNVGKGIAIVLPTLLYCLLVCKQVSANELAVSDNSKVVFTALPEQCVTLRQGRSCFATVELQWKSPSKQSFCLYQEGEKKQLGCWKNSNHVQIKIDFESNKSVKYQLRKEVNDKVVAEAQVEVSWQHKNTARKRRWRLF